jgi:hypothetical protein
MPLGMIASGHWVRASNLRTGGPSPNHPPSLAEIIAMAEHFEFTFRVEMASGQEQRVVEADGYHEDNLWVKFYRKGQLYWMANRDQVVSMECCRND